MNSVPSPKLMPGLSSEGGHALAAKESRPDADWVEDWRCHRAEDEAWSRVKPKVKNIAIVKNPTQASLLDLGQAHHQETPS